MYGSISLNRLPAVPLLALFAAVSTSYHGGERPKQSDMKEAGHQNTDAQSAFLQPVGHVAFLYFSQRTLRRKARDSTGCKWMSSEPPAASPRKRDV